MFVTGPRNNAAALDARTGRPIWHIHAPAARRHPCALHGDDKPRLRDSWATACIWRRWTAHLVALDAKTGNVIWDMAVDDYKTGLSITHAPLAIDGKIIVGITAGECALTGFVDAYDAATGKRLWRVNTIAEQGRPARAPPGRATRRRRRRSYVDDRHLRRAIPTRCSGPPAIRRPTTTVPCARATIFTRAASWRSIRRRES